MITGISFSSWSQINESTGRISYWLPNGSYEHEIAEDLYVYFSYDENHHFDIRIEQRYPTRNEGDLESIEVIVKDFNPEESAFAFDMISFDYTNKTFGDDLDLKSYQFFADDEAKTNFRVNEAPYLAPDIKKLLKTDLRKANFIYFNQTVTPAVLKETTRAEHARYLKPLESLFEELFDLFSAASPGDTMDELNAYETDIRSLIKYIHTNPLNQHLLGEDLYLRP